MIGIYKNKYDGIRMDEGNSSRTYLVVIPKSYICIKILMIHKRFIKCKGFIFNLILK